MASRLPKKVRQIDEARESLQAQINTFLRSRGWVYTCDTPGSHWLWMKTLNGQVLLVDQAYALSIERSVDSGAV